MVNGKKFLDIGLVLFFYFQLERYFEETTFCNSVFYLLPLQIYLCKVSIFLALFQILKKKGISFFKNYKHIQPDLWFLIIP
ncbi:hypothetical protein [Leptospira noguchii]|uniref:hypothetical protein n=1 Tax=Leptospira noguchii TaxID=28182 RepID=UPI000297575D|nr:hypothetical protein [Leptospira noguchii]EKR71340.1 hypothetical protein LEP1GSC041_0039 [Leptospira noguchii str. 2006001870]UOG62580.1 hypothetical protein MAL07_19495 [Leptospira noguchii]